MTIPTIKPMKLTDMPFESAEQYLSDPDWFLEQKMDGAYALITWDRDLRRITSWQASGGGPLKFAAAVQWFASLEYALAMILVKADAPSAVFAGELIVETGELHLFDMIWLDGEVEPSDRYDTRRYWLGRTFEGRDLEGLVKLVGAAGSALAKTELWFAINAGNVEGAVAKRKDGAYEPGLRTKNQIKLKLVKSADVVVTGITNWTSTTGSASLGVPITPDQDPQPWKNARGKRDAGGWDLLVECAIPPKGNGWTYEPRHMLPIGNSSLIGKDRSIEVGSVVEINYLYWTGEAVVQPRIMRKRRAEEKAAIDCTLEQFPTYSRVAVKAVFPQ